MGPAILVALITSTTIITAGLVSLGLVLPKNRTTKRHRYEL